MAALATAAISRVGTQTSGAQAQVTITMTATVRAAAPATAAPSLVQLPSASPTTAESTIEPVTDETRIQTLQAGRSTTASRTTVAQPIATAPAASTSAPVVWLPNIGTLPPSSPSTSPDASKKPTTKPTKTPTPSATKPTLEASATLSDWWWSRRQGGIHAGCRGDRLVYAEPWAATGYRVVKSSNWIRTAIFFTGPSPVTVLVGCHDGHPTFSTSS